MRLSKEEELELARVRDIEKPIEERLGEELAANPVQVIYEAILLLSPLKRKMLYKKLSKKGW